MRVIITAGDPAGIGSEVCVKLLDRRSGVHNKLRRLVGKKQKIQVVILGVRSIFEDIIDRFGVPLKFGVSGEKVVLRVVLGGCGILNRGGMEVEFIDIPLGGGIVYGKASRAGGKHVLGMLKKALDLIRIAKDSGGAVLVNGPLNKEAVSMEESGFVGHTGFLAGCTGSEEVSMCFVSSVFDLVLITGHLSLKGGLWID